MEKYLHFVEVVMLSCFGRLSSGWQLRPVYYFAVQIPNLILYLSIWNPDPNSKCRTLNRYIDFKLCLLWFPFQNPVLHQISLIQWSPKIINHSWCYVSIQNVFFSEWYLGQYVTAVWEMHQLSVFFVWKLVLNKKLGFIAMVEKKMFRTRCF